MTTTDAKAGPYKVDRTPPNHVVPVVTGPGISEEAFGMCASVLAGALNTAYAHGQRTANAELVEALRDIESHCAQRNDHERSAIRKIAIAALAKHREVPK